MPRLLAGFVVSVLLATPLAGGLAGTDDETAGSERD